MYAKRPLLVGSDIINFTIQEQFWIEVFLFFSIFSCQSPGTKLPQIDEQIIGFETRNYTKGSF